MYFISLLSIYGIFTMAFCALSIAFKSVEDHDAGDGFGKRWYAIVIFVYDFIVSNHTFNV